MVFIYLVALNINFMGEKMKSGNLINILSRKSVFVILSFLVLECSCYSNTWVGFGERESGDQLLILDERITNSTIPISQSIIFQYEDLDFTFANLTVYDGFDKVIHTYASYLSMTEVQFINTTHMEAQIAIYGFRTVPVKKQQGLTESKPKKMVFSNNKKRV